MISINTVVSHRKDIDATDLNGDIVMMDLEKGQYFDVTPYAEAAGEHLMEFIKTVKLPRKLKVLW